MAGATLVAHGTDNIADFDAGPLSWVQGEIDDALARGLDALETFAAVPADATPLKHARTHIHQAAGAIQMVGLDAVAAFTDEVERQLARLDDLPAADVAAACATIDRACRKLRIFLDELVGGALPVPLKLFPEYEAMQRARGVRATAPTDLFYPDLAAPAPRLAGAALPAAQMPSFLVKQRRVFQRGLLAWLRGSADGARQMREVIRAIEGVSGQANLRSFWWTVGALIDAVQERGLEPSFGVKQLAARVDLQIRRLAEGSAKVADRLRREVLYFVAISAPVAPSVVAVQKSFRLGGLIPSAEVLNADLVRIQPHLREARDLLAQAKDTWLKFTSGRAENLPKLKQGLAAVHQHATHTGNGALMKLTSTLVARLDRMSAGNVSEPVAMEYATALLLADSAFQNYGKLSGEFPSHVDAMLARLDAAQAARPFDGGGAPVLEEMSRRAQDRMLLAQVGREIQANLRHMEQVLDAFFRDHARRNELAALVKDSAQVRGALRMLDLQAAEALLASCEEQIASYADPATPITDDDLELLAESLSGLGFYIEAVEQQRVDHERLIRPLLAKRRGEPVAAPEAENDTLEAAVAEMREALPALVAEVHRAPTDMAARATLRERLTVLRDDAELIGDTDLVAQAKAALQELEAGGTSAPAGGALAALAELPEPSAAPEVSQETQRLLATEDHALDAELLDIFLAEAAEVLDTVVEQHRILSHNPADREALRTARRQFHTLKGSGRMVGLTALGEIAYDVEKIHNRLLEEERTVTPAVLGLIETGESEFRRWVGELKASGHVAVDPQRLHDAIRNVEAELPGHGESVLKGRDAAVSITSAPARADVIVPAPAVAAGPTAPATPAAVPPPLEAAPAHEPDTAVEPEITDADALASVLAAYRGAAIELPAEMLGAPDGAAPLEPVTATRAAGHAQGDESGLVPATFAVDLAPGSAAGEVGEVVEGAAAPAVSFADEAFEALDLDVSHGLPSGATAMGGDMAPAQEALTAAPAYVPTQPVMEPVSVTMDDGVADGEAFDAGELADADALPSLLAPDLLEPAEADALIPAVAGEAVPLDAPAPGAMPVAESKLPGAEDEAADRPDQSLPGTTSEPGTIAFAAHDAAGPDATYAPSSAESMLDELAEALALDAAALEPTIDLELPAIDEAFEDIAAGGTIPDAHAGAEAEPADPAMSADEITVGGVTLARSLYDILVVEAEEHLATLGHELAVMQFDPAYGVSAAMVRASHTLCGIHRTGGFALVPATAKALEQCLIALQGRDEPLPDSAQAVVAEAIDVLGLLVARVRDRESFDERDAQDAERVQARLEALRQQYEQEQEAPDQATRRAAGFAARGPDVDDAGSAADADSPDAEAKAGLSNLLASVAAELARFESAAAARSEQPQPAPSADGSAALDTHGAGPLVPPEVPPGPAEFDGHATSDGAAAEPAGLLDMDLDSTDGTVDALIESALAELTAAETDAPVAPSAFADAAQHAAPAGIDRQTSASAEESGPPREASSEPAAAGALAGEAPAQPASSLDALWSGHSAASNDDSDATAAAHPGGDDVVPAAVHTPLDQIKDEVDEQLLPIFLEEAEELFPQAGEQLRAWRRAPDDATHGSGLRRTLHTFKGSARMAGAMRLGELAHRMESRLLRGDELATGTPELFEALDADLDRVAFVLDALREGRTNVSTPWLDVAEPVLATAEGPAPDARAAVAHEVSGVVVPLPGVAAAFGAESAERTAAEELRPAAEHDAAQRAMLRVRADVIDRLVNEAGEVAIARGRVEGELRALKNNLLELTNSVIRMRAQVREIEIQAESQIQSRLSVRNEGDPDFDPLEFDRFTRFQELTRSLAEGINDVSTVQQSLLRNVDDADAALVAQARLSRDVQQQLFAIRTVPFNSLSERLYRILRQVAKELDKRVNLDIRGAQVELDRSVLEKLVGPLEHLLRNALDHGVESRDARVAAGKSPVGEIVLTVRQLGNEIAIELADDGAGLDFERIRARAVAQGRVAPDAVASEAELIECIFQPGFSTAARVTHVSGRGIGMDVVRSDIAALGGRVEVSSRPGQGTSFTLYLPLTLAVAQAVLVRAGGRLWALPAPMVEQVQQVKTDNLVEFYASRRIRWQGRTYPFHYLPRLLGDVEHTPITARFNPVLLLRTGQGFAAVHVDEMIGNQEVVVKNIGPQLARVSGIAGATVLGTGEIVLIINPVQLAQRPQVPGFDPGAEERVVASQADAPGVRPPMAMIVDDSLTVRKITSRLLTREGFEVVTAKDGLEALQRLDEARPDVILLDIEMPRMDGFEFTKTIKADARHAHIPIVMITSRTAEKHRNRARELGVDLYLGKPYQEQELLQTLREMLSVTA